MKFLKKFNESKDERDKIPLDDFLDTISKTKHFIEEEIRDMYDSEEWPNNFISDIILDQYGGFKDIVKGEKNFPYKLVKVYSENGDGKDEETRIGIFKRVSDGKFFKLWSHDAGFIGPETLTSPDYLEEVFPMKSKKVKFK